jgi:hypothetical protein
MRGLEIFEQALSDVENGRVSDAELEPVSGW